MAGILTLFAVKLTALLALLALLIIIPGRSALGAEIDAICANRKDAHCVSLPPYNALANINATVDCDLPKDFIATDSSPSGARAAFPDNSKGRFLGQCKGDPAQQQWELVWSNKDGSKLQAAHFNAHPKDAKSTVRFSDNSGRDPEPNATLISHTPGVDVIWTCRS